MNFARQETQDMEYRQPRHLQVRFSMIIWLSVFFLSTSFGYASAEQTGSDMAPVSLPVVAEIAVELLNFPGDEAVWIEMARSLISLRAGDRFSADQLQASIDALKKCKRFQKINVDSSEAKEGITVVFHLTPFRLIKDIKIDGAFPLFEREVLNVMTVRVGDVYIEERLSQEEALIANLFRKQGFTAPEISVTATPGPDDKHFIIHVGIEKGPYYTLERLEIQGSQSFSDTRLKMKMRTWYVSHFPGSAGRFVEEDLKKDVSKLKHYFWKRGYADAQVDYRVERNSKTMGVSVFVTVVEGPAYKVELSGNDRFWDRTLKKDLVVFLDGNRNDVGLRKSIRKMKERYRSAGYPDAKVNIEEKTDVNKEPGTRRIRLVFDEGPCSIVDSIQITGNMAFDDEKIQKQMLTHTPGFLDEGVFVPETLDDDLNVIRALYRKSGYMDAQVKKDLTWNSDRSRVGVHIAIEEGVQTIVSTVKINGLSLLSEEEAREVIRLKAGAPFRKYMIQSDENTLSALIAEKGYPHVEVTGESSISEDHSEASMSYDVHEGPYVEMGCVYYRGNFRTKERILENELGLKPDEPFSLSRMLKGQRNLRNLDILESVTFNTIGLEEKREKVDLYVDVEERKPYYVQAGGGYDSERGFFALTRLGDHNLFGTNKDAWLAGEVSQIGYRGETGFKEPRLFGSRISTTLGAFSERRAEFNQDFGTETQGVSFGLSRSWHKNLDTDLSFRFERRDQFVRDREKTVTGWPEDMSDEFEPRSILVTTPSIRYDSRDSFIRPKKGIFSQFAVDISKGLSNSLDDFFRYSLDLRYYWTPFQRLTFAWHGRVGHVDPYGSNQKVPDDQLFFLGGITDVRGFAENLLRYDSSGDPVGGRTAITGSVEARIDLGHNIELITFYDTGSVRETFDEVGTDEFRDAVGLGFGYVTPIGPIGLLYGIKLDPQDGESLGRFHFSIGYTF